MPQDLLQSVSDSLAYCALLFQANSAPTGVMPIVSINQGLSSKLLARRARMFEDLDSISDAEVEAP
jgi:hypothetical protein